MGCNQELERAGEHPVVKGGECAYAGKAPPRRGLFAVLDEPWRSQLHRLCYWSVNDDSATHLDRA